MLPPHLHPHFIKFENPKNKLNLTFSAIVDNSDNSVREISKIQDYIEEIITKSEGLEHIRIEKNKANLPKGILAKDRFIYKYPKDTFHFSIANFLTYDIGDENFDNSRETIRETDDFNKLLEKIQSFKKRIYVNVDNIEASVKMIYLPGGIKYSIALSVFPNNEDFLEILKKEGEYIKKEMAKELIDNDFEIKAHPKENFRYFALNIFRFIIANNEKDVIKNGNFCDKLREISKKLQKEPIEVKMKPHIVISDPYLANKEPIIG